MTLANWLKTNRIPAHIFAQRLGVSTGAVHKWTQGQRIPRPHMMARIKYFTNGSVMADDWLEADFVSLARQRGAA